MRLVRSILSSLLLVFGLCGQAVSEPMTLSGVGGPAAGGISCPSTILTSPNFTSGWTTNAATLTANAASDPNAGSTAATLVEAATSNFHFATQTNSKAASGVTYTAAVYSSGTGRNLVLQVDDVGSNGVVVYFDTTNHVHSPAGDFNFGTGYAASAQTVSSSANGFWKYSFTVTSNSVTSVRVIIGLTALITTPSSDNNYLGNGTSGLTIWCASLQ